MKISHSMRKSRGGAAAGLRTGLSERNFEHHAKPLEAAKEFRIPCEISHGMRNLPMHQLR